VVSSVPVALVKSGSNGLMAFAVLGLCCQATGASAEREVIPLGVADAFSGNEFLRNGGSAVFSPDNAHLAYVSCDQKRRAAAPRDNVTVFVATRGSAMYTLGCDIWVSPTAGGPAINVSGGVGNSWGPAWSPDGAQLAFVSDRDGGARLWLWDPHSKAVRKVSDERIRNGVGAERVEWLPDGTSVLVRLRPVGMTDKELGEDDNSSNAGAATQSQKVDAVTVKVYHAAPRTTQPNASGDSGEPQRDDSSIGVPKTIISDVGILSIETGRVRRMVERAPLVQLALAPDGKSFFYVEWTKPAANLGPAITLHDLVSVQILSGERRVLAPEIPMHIDTAVSWSPDSRKLAYFGVTSPDQMGNLEVGRGSISHADLFVVSTADARITHCASTQKIVGFDSDYARPLWSPASDAVYAIADNKVWRGDIASGRCQPLGGDPAVDIRQLVDAGNRGVVWAPRGSLAMVMTRHSRSKKDGFYAVGADGRLHKRFERSQRLGGDYTAFASADGSRLAFQAQSAAEPEDLWITNASFAKPMRLTRLNPQLEKYRFGSARLIEFTSASGKPLQASLLLPADYQPGKRYPTIVLVYASEPGSRNVHTFGLVNFGQYNYQMFATRGFAVLNPDIPVNLGTPMQDLIDAVLPAVDKVVELGITDTDRVGVTGQSNGGYSTLATIAQTNRFKAAVMNAGFGDLAGMYGVMNANDGSGGWHQWLLRLGGGMGVPPWENPQRYLQNSPLYYLDRITTPLLIQAGTLDSGIVPFSDQIYVGLKQLGKDVTYLRYEGEGHLLEIPANRVDYWDRTMEFWNHHLGAARPANSGST
jgi:dipeptidyl aminopeptidase/acylaminoacyl peptidase